MMADDVADRAAAATPDEASGTAPGRGRLAGRHVLVVGGGQDDHGVEDPPIWNGRAMSVLFGRECAAVAVADIKGDSAEATALRVGDEGAEVTTLVADAADEAASATMFSKAREALGGLPRHAASKAALESLCRQAAVEGAPGIRRTLREDELATLASCSRIATRSRQCGDRP
jgi:NAD(P)-dependent dehydrogenase (short-subunit alcohol dehydrogenase family)